jgi:hypothetical protein
MTVQTNSSHLSGIHLASEHICCGFSDKKCAEGYEMKKTWLANEFENGYVFRRAFAPWL